MAKTQNITKNITTPKKSAKEKPLVPNVTKRNSILLGIVGVTLSIGAGYMLAVTPALTAQEEQRLALLDAENAYTKSQQDLATALRFEEQYPIAKEQHNALAKNFPSSANVSEFDTLIKVAAREAGVTLDSLITQTPETITTQTDVPVAPTMDGGELNGEAPAEDIPAEEAPVEETPAEPARPVLASIKPSISATGSVQALLDFESRLKDIDRSLIITASSLSINGSDSKLDINGVSYMYAPISDPLAAQEESPSDSESGTESDE